MANLENLKKVREAIVKFKNKFNYIYCYTDSVNRSPFEFFLDVDDPEIIESVLSDTNDCGTCACVAGFCVSLSYAEKPFDVAETGFSEAARDWLGISNRESIWLFEPRDFNDEKERWYSSGGYLPQFEYDLAFPGFETCTQEQGYNEALRRLDFLIEHYSKVN
jgi:hypothetical protein